MNKSIANMVGINIAPIFVVQNSRCTCLICHRLPTRHFEIFAGRSKLVELTFLNIGSKPIHRQPTAGAQRSAVNLTINSVLPVLLNWCIT